MANAKKSCAIMRRICILCKGRLPGEGQGRYFKLFQEREGMLRTGQDLQGPALTPNGKNSLQRFAVRAFGLLQVNQ